jgi:hypothetical protein
MAGLIGVTQREIENDFYMVDLARMAEIKRKQQALQKLELLQIVHARQLEQKDYEELVRRYTNEAEIKRKEAKFNRSKFEELRAIT